MTAVAPQSQRVIRAVGQLPLIGPLRRGALRGTRLTHRSRAAVVPVREDLPLLLNARGLTGCGVEVGVKRGEFSEFILSSWRGRHLISVDPWLAAPEQDYVDVANVPQTEHDAFYAETKGRLERFGERSSVWRMFGGEAAEKLPHHSLDFVYLDARHDEASVREDLETWAAKVRPGGILAGHDYVDGLFPEGEFGVRSAVDAFFAERSWTVRSTFLDPPWFSWWVGVPR